LLAWARSFEKESWCAEAAIHRRTFARNDEEGIMKAQVAILMVLILALVLVATTAQAGEVMSWVEFLLQAAWPDLKVQVASNGPGGIRG
jgi:glycine cleavage system aminomethyltransferase T